MLSSAETQNEQTTYDSKQTAEECVMQFNQSILNDIYTKSYVKGKGLESLITANFNERAKKMFSDSACGESFVKVYLYDEVDKILNEHCPEFDNNNFSIK